MEAFIGQISMFGFNWPPLGWALCNGQTLSIPQQQVLFALIGVNYGGNGSTTFMLPNLQGRLPLHFGSNGAQAYNIGTVGGNSTTPVTTTTSFTLSSSNLPAHTHTATLALPTFTATTNIKASSTTATGQQSVPENGSTLTNSPPAGQVAANIYLPPSTAQNAPVNLGGVTTTVNASGGSVTNANTGSGTPVTAPLNFSIPTMSPFLAINFCIALEGIFPSRN